VSLDLSRPYRLHPKVALRPERFGALAYSYDTRRLSLLRDPLLADLVRALGEAPSAGDALGDVPEARRPAVQKIGRGRRGSRPIDQAGTTQQRSEIMHFAAMIENLAVQA